MTTVEEMRRLEREASLKQIPGLTSYFADESGTIWSSTGWRGSVLRKMVGVPDHNGYLKVRLMVALRRRKSRSVHSLVCAAFYGQKPSPLHEVRHLNGRRTDNRPSNLAWGTKSENAKDRKEHGTERAAENGRKSAGKLRRTHCYRGHEYTRIRKSDGGNFCGHCQRERRAEAKALSKLSKGEP